MWKDSGTKHYEYKTLNVDKKHFPHNKLTKLLGITEEIVLLSYGVNHLFISSTGRLIW